MVKKHEIIRLYVSTFTFRFRYHNKHRSRSTSAIFPHSSRTLCHTSVQRSKIPTHFRRRRGALKDQRSILNRTYQKVKWTTTTTKREEEEKENSVYSSTGMNNVEELSDSLHFSCSLASLTHKRAF